MIQETLRAAIQKHQQGDLANASTLYLKVLQMDPNNVEALGLMSMVAETSGDHDTAIGLATKAIELKPNRVELYINLANPLLSSARVDEAIKTLEQAIKVDRRSVDVLSTLGDAYQEKKEYDRAIEFYHKGLRLDRSDPILYNNLGNALRNLGSYDEAISYYEKALSLKPDYLDAKFNFANLYRKQNNEEQAKALYQDILDSSPDHYKAHRELARVAYKEHELGEAIKQYKLALKYNPDTKDTLGDLVNLGEIYISQQNYDLAEECARIANKLDPENAKAIFELAQIYHEQCKPQEAQEMFEKLCELEPNNLGHEITRALSLPILFDSVEAVNTARDQLQNQLENLLNADLSQYLMTGAGKTGFYLSYHGKDDRRFNEMLAKLSSYAVKPITRIPQVKNEKIKVGIISCHLSAVHTIGKLYQGIIKNICRDKFQVVLFSVGSNHRYEVTGEEHCTDVFVDIPNELKAAKELIIEQNIDILFFPDIGMDMASYYIASNKLAKVQCVSWGHPVTTGLPSMDYFISSELIEPENSDRYYSENLIKMKTMPVCYSKPPMVDGGAVRQVLGIHEHENLYLCPQSLFKIHPDFDEYMAGILRKDVNGKLVLLSYVTGNPNTVLKARFDKYMPDVSDRIIFSPRLSRGDFLKLISAADVMLDPLHFGGGNTTYEALAYGTPLVTMPGEFMRGRITAGCYQKMGYTELVATSKEEYVDLAVKVGSDPKERARVRQEILSKCDVLYDDYSAVRELEAFFIQALEKAEQGGEHA